MSVPVQYNSAIHRKLCGCKRAYHGGNEVFELIAVINKEMNHPDGGLSCSDIESYGEREEIRMPASSILSSHLNNKSFVQCDKTWCIRGVADLDDSADWTILLDCNGVYPSLRDSYNGLRSSKFRFIGRILDMNKKGPVLGMNISIESKRIYQSRPGFIELR